MPLPVEPVLVPQPTEIAEAFVAAMPEPEFPEPSEPVTLAVVPELPTGAAPVELPPDLNAPDLNAVFELPVEPVTGLSPEILAASAEPAPPEPIALSWPEPESAEPWQAEPELPPAPVAPPVVLHPPVSAAELPPLAAPAKKPPFWKKELSVSRKPKAEKTEKAAEGPEGPEGRKGCARAEREGCAVLEEGALARPQAKGCGGRSADRAAAGRREDAIAQAEALAPVALAPEAALPRRRARVGHSSKKVVGLKIGASQIAAARISNNGVAELQQLARDPLAAGVIVAGELRDPEALGDALKVFFARHKLPKKGVRLGIASNRIGVRILEIVGVEEEKQLANAVQFRAQEALPIPLDEAVLDYRVLEESVDAEGQKVKRVLLVVAYRELIDRYVSACRKAGINLDGIDLEAFALLARARCAGRPRGLGARCGGHRPRPLDLRGLGRTRSASSPASSSGVARR